MRSSHLPFKISITLILFILLFSSQSIFAQSGWQSTYSNNVFILNKIIKRDSLNYFAFSDKSRFYLKSTDGGNSWFNSPEFALDSMYVIRDGVFINSNTGWIVGNSYYYATNGVVFKTTDAGQNWIKQNTGIYSYVYNNINIADLNTIWISIGNTPPYSTLIKSTDAGNTWNAVPNPLTYRISQVKFSDINTGWIFATNGGFLSKTTNSGIDWLMDSTFRNFSIYSIVPLTQNDCWILVRDATPASKYYKTTNGGQNWNLIYTNKNLMGELKFFDAQTGFAYSGVNNIILKTTNGGSNWDSLYINSSQPVTAVLPASKIEILAAGGRVTGSNEPPNTFVNIVKSTNGGLNWNQKFYNRIYSFTDIHFKDNQTGLAIESGGLILRTTNGGTNWIKIYENSVYSFNIIKAFSDTSVFIFTTNGKILRSNNFGDNWTLIDAPGNDSKNIVKFVNELTGYAIGSCLYMLKTTNGGLNWDSLVVPTTGTGFYINFGLWTARYNNMCFINVDTGWIIGNDFYVINGGGSGSHSYYLTTLQKTTDGGANWSVKYKYTEVDVDIRYKMINFTNDTIGYMYGSNIIRKTTNSGTNWTNYSNLGFYCGKLNMLNENTGWIGGSDNIGSAIFKTTNSGLNWFTQFHEFDKPVNSIFIKDENNLWFCGGNNAIYKTTNGGGIISAINHISSNIPERFSLKQNYPNPFNPTTNINFDLKNTTFALLRVYDITGREVRTLVNEKLNAGSYSYDFNASELPSGVYFYQLQADGFVETKKMILLK